MNIRDATPADARRIAEIHVESWRQAYRGIMPEAVLDGLSVEEREQRWQRNLAEKQFVMLVAVEQGVIVGWATFGRSRDDDTTPGTAEVYGLYLDPACRRRGIGRALWQTIMHRLGASGVREAIVRVLAENDPARHFYEAMGGVLEPDAARTICRGGKELIEMRYRCRP